MLGRRVDDLFFPMSMRLEDSVYTHELHRFFPSDPGHDGAYTLVARAIDCVAQFSSETILEFKVYTPAEVTVPPIAVIHDPHHEESAEGAIVENPRSIIKEGLYPFRGAAYHEDAGVTVEYKIELFNAKIGDNDPKYWNSGYVIWAEAFVKNITPGLVAGEEYVIGSFNHGVGESLELDLSGVDDGNYELLLTVRTVGGAAYSYAHVPFILDCPLKIGNVMFTQEDVVIPVGGIPLRVTRTYDSFKRNKDGDFGYGWSYSIANMDIELKKGGNTKVIA